MGLDSNVHNWYATLSSWGVAGLRVLALALIGVVIAACDFLYRGRMSSK
jgi:hypothetical protein